GDDNFGDEDYSVSNLPQNILSFIEINYPGVSIEKAEKESNGNFEIKLSNDVEIIFDADGEFLGQAKDEQDDDDILISELPGVIQNYIGENYPDLSIVEAEQKSNGSYEVTLSNGIELKFDADGNFISADDQNGEDEEED
ncbi:MAG: PepSY-like domain-containing protein, partial [Salinimicrobium sp.]